VSIEVKLLGVPTFLSSGSPIKLHSTRVIALFAYLMSEAGKPVPREFLITLCWPEDQPQRARQSLRQALHSLRKALGDLAEVCLTSDEHSVTLSSHPLLPVDVLRFEALTQSGEENPDSLQQAIDLYQGAFLEAISVPNSPEFEDWLHYRRQELEGRYLNALHRLVEHLLTQGEHGEALPLAQRLAFLTPLNEEAHACLMKAYAGLSNFTAVKEQFELCSALLDRELGVAPSLDTKSLYYDLMMTTRALTNLPAPTTPFVGREREVNALIRHLNDPNIRLVNIVGTGGMGKTRLGLEVAHELVDAFAHGVFYVSLAELETTDRVVQVVAQRLDLQGGLSPRQQILDHFQRKELLIVLDNCEPFVADLIKDILENAPGVKILTTSRERLSMTSEFVVMLSGMDVPADNDIVQIETFSSARLFTTALQRLQPSYSLQREDLTSIGRICRFVQGMPLAILLAASWADTLTLREIAEEIAAHLDFLATDLKDLPERHRSMRAVIESSWKKLRPHEQVIFSHLSVFRSGFTRHAAQEVTGVSPQTISILVNKSLLQFDPESGRYEIHELLRQFAGQHGDTRPAQAAHSNFFLRLLQTLEPKIKGQDQQDALALIRPDFENIRAAWLWAVKMKQDDAIDGALEALYLYCDACSRYEEGSELLQEAQKQLEDRAPDIASRLAVRFARLRSRSGHYVFEGSQKIVESALRNAYRQELLPEIAFCYATIGILVIGTQEWTKALDQLTKAVQLYWELGDEFYVGQLLNRIGYCYGQSGDLGLFRRFTEKSLEHSRKVGNRVDSAHALMNLGYIRALEGDYDRAEYDFEEAVAFARQTGSIARVIHSSAGLGLIQFLRGHIESAVAISDIGLKMAVAANFRVTRAYALAVRGLLACATEDFQKAREVAEESKTFSSNSMGLFLADWGLTLAYCGLEDFELATSHLQAALEYQPIWHHHGQGAATWLLPGMAMLLASKGQLIEAAECIALAFSHSRSATGWIKQYLPIRKLLAELESELGSKLYCLASERGQSLEVHTLLGGERLFQ
jgi:DNA-binding SARP family transcriptional activator